MLITPQELPQLKGKQIQTTIQNLGTVKACVGAYDAVTNRVQLQNIINIHDGTNHGTMGFLPSELVGYSIISQTCPQEGTSPTGPPTQTEEGDCLVTGGPGKSIASGSLPPIPTPVGVFIIRYEVNECQIVAITYLNNVEVGRETLKRGKNSFEWKKDFRTFVVKATGWVVDKVFYLGLEVRTGGRVVFRDHWRIGSWQSLKI